MSSISTRRTVHPQAVAGIALCISLFAAAGCGSPNAGGHSSGSGGKNNSGSGGSSSGGNSGSGGNSSSGGNTGSGGSSSTGGNSGSGGDTSTGGANGTGGSSTGGSGTGGDSGTGGSGTGGMDTSGTGGMDATGGAGGMSFQLKCGIATATNDVYSAALASNAPNISDFTYTDGSTGIRADGFFIGDTYNQVTALSYHFPNAPPPVAAGGADGGGTSGGGTSGAGGTAGHAGAGGQAGGSAAGGNGGAGGTAVVPGPGPIGITEDMTASNWHITGWVGQSASAFVMNFVCLIDASAYDGVEFTLKGNAGTPSTLTMQAAFAGDEPGDYVVPGMGLCNSGLGACSAPFAMINVPATVATVQVPWTAFTGGKPVSALDPKQLVLFRWSFISRPTPYPVDVTLDDMKFYSANAAAAPLLLRARDRP